MPEANTVDLTFYVANTKFLGEPYCTQKGQNSIDFCPSECIRVNNIILLLLLFSLQLINELEFLIDDTPESELSPQEADRYKSVSFLLYFFGFKTGFFPFPKMTTNI